MRLGAASPAHTAAPRNRVEDRDHADEKIGDGKRRDFPRLDPQPLFEDFGYVSHRVEIARADEAFSHSRGRGHRQQLQLSDVTDVDHVEPKTRQRRNRAVQQLPDRLERRGKIRPESGAENQAGVDGDEFKPPPSALCHAHAARSAIVFARS